MALIGSDLQTAVLWVGAELETLLVIGGHNSLDIFQCVGSRTGGEPEGLPHIESHLNGRSVLCLIDPYHRTQYTSGVSRIHWEIERFS